jgi:hypothetical protein
MSPATASGLKCIARLAMKLEAHRFRNRASRFVANHRGAPLPFATFRASGSSRRIWIIDGKKLTTSCAFVGSKRK